MMTSGRSYTFLVFSLLILASICSNPVEGLSVSDTTYHYWIKFPADVKAECANDPNIPGVVDREMGCDLIAVSHKDVIFPATSDSACYKILRTYRAINWCEYDNESAPTVVSRDWDGWNGLNPGRCGTPRPDGDDKPGDEDIYVIVYRQLSDGKADTVWYDRDSNPYNNIPDNDNTDEVEGYWWKVSSGGDNPRYESYYEDNCSAWSYDLDQSDSDISGNLSSDDSDIRYGSFGFWQYTQHIVVYDTTVPELTVTGPDTFCAVSNADCSGEVTFTISTSDACSAEDLTIKVSLDLNNDGVMDGDVSSQVVNSVFSGRYPEGEHKILVEANDGCGNKTYEHVVFQVVDCLAPAPICIEGLSVELTPEDVGENGPRVTVWDADFLTSEVYDCNGQDAGQTDAFGNPLVTKFSINRVGQPVDEFQKSLEFLCADADTGIILVEIHAWDAVGNHDFCQTYVEVQDNEGSCQPAPVLSMSGVIHTAKRQMVAGVNVQITGDRRKQLSTDESGIYVLDNMEMGDHYKIIPQMEDDYMNGISTADYLKIHQHILNTEPFKTPYQILAADINDDHKVNIYDLLKVRKMILGLETEMPNNWRFIPKRYKFPSPANPWAEEFPQYIEYTVTGEPDFNVDFIAVKTGDVDYTAKTNSQKTTDPRSGQALQLLIPDQQLQEGTVYILPVRAEDLQAITGFQFSLGWDQRQLEVLEFQPGKVGTESVALFRERGVLTTSWINTGDQIAADQPLFQLVVRARTDLGLEQALSIRPFPTPAEAYTTDEARLKIQLISREMNPLAVSSLQVAPNPFREQTQLQFELPQAGLVELILSDVQGRVISTRQVRLNAGVQQLVIRAEDLEAAGVYFYEVRTRDGAFRGKLLLN